MHQIFAIFGYGCFTR